MEVRIIDEDEIEEYLKNCDKFIDFDCYRDKDFISHDQEEIIRPTMGSKIILHVKDKSYTLRNIGDVHQAAIIPSGLEHRIDTKYGNCCAHYLKQEAKSN